MELLRGEVMTEQTMVAVLVWLLFSSLLWLIGNSLRIRKLEDKLARLDSALAEHLSLDNRYERVTIHAEE